MNEKNKRIIDWENELKDIDLTLPNAPKIEAFDENISNYKWQSIPTEISEMLESRTEEKDSSWRFDFMLKGVTKSDPELRLIAVLLGHNIQRLAVENPAYIVKKGKQKIIGMKIYMMDGIRTNDDLETYGGICIGQSEILSDKIFDRGLSHITDMVNNDLRTIGKPLLPPFIV